ncbi:MAG: hypothetical protein HZB70_00605 [Candidatus Berkelbacteria bacterium]|nr:MAG: hypothetical protein HZB70_00605 [Candidatus Berkelbacteria bacterium]QQG51392.1 MAG: hypothetical protein HY845_02395 [Candidatus Berkelbacteria bacterium]
MKRISDTFFVIAVVAFAAAVLYEYGERTQPYLATRWASYGHQAWLVFAVAVGLGCFFAAIQWLVESVKRKRQHDDETLVEKTRIAVLAEETAKLLETESKRAKLFAQMGVNGAGQVISRR